MHCSPILVEAALAVVAESAADLDAGRTLRAGCDNKRYGHGRSTFGSMTKLDSTRSNDRSGCLVRIAKSDVAILDKRDNQPPQRKRRLPGSLAASASRQGRAGVRAECASQVKRLARTRRESSNAQAQNQHAWALNEERSPSGETYMRARLKLVSIPRKTTKRTKSVTNCQNATAFRNFSPVMVGTGIGHGGRIESQGGRVTSVSISAQAIV